MPRPKFSNALLFVKDYVYSRGVVRGSGFAAAHQCASPKEPHTQE